MSIIKVPVRFEGSKGEKIIYTLFDSGASFSCISPENALEIGIVEKMRHPLEVAAAILLKLKIHCEAIFTSTT